MGESSPKGVPNYKKPQGPGTLTRKQNLDQIRLDAVASGLKLGGAHGGYISDRIDLQRNSVYLFWHGPVPNAILPKVGIAAREGVRVHVISAPYSETELVAVRDQILRNADSLGISMVGDKPDGTGFRVFFKTSANAFAAKAALSGSTQPTLSSFKSLWSKPGAPVISLVAKPFPLKDLEATRNYDSPPFYAGGRAVTSDGNCTVGAPLKKGSLRYFAAAGHCTNYTSYVNVYSGSAIYIGNTQHAATLASDGYDAALIGIGSGSSLAGLMWDGGPSTDVADDVVGDSSTDLGDTVCQSGASSGTICNLYVNGTATLLRGAYKFKVFTTRNTTGNPAASGGDSGGVVFTRAAGDENVIVRGVVQGGGGANNTTMTFTDIKQIERITSTSIVIGVG